MASTRLREFDTRPDLRPILFHFSCEHRAPRSLRAIRFRRLLLGSLELREDGAGLGVVGIQANCHLEMFASPRRRTDGET